MTPTETPQPIKDAAEKYAKHIETDVIDKSALHYCKDVVKYAESDFIAGALHPETEKYYREKFEAEATGFNEWVLNNGFRKATHPNRVGKLYSDNFDGYHTWEGLITLYKQSLTKNKEDDKS